MFSPRIEIKTKDFITHICVFSWTIDWKTTNSKKGNQANNFRTLLLTCLLASHIRPDKNQLPVSKNRKKLLIQVNLKKVNVYTIIIDRNCIKRISEDAWNNLFKIYAKMNTSSGSFKETPRNIHFDCYVYSSLNQVRIGYLSPLLLQIIYLH